MDRNTKHSLISKCKIASLSPPGLVFLFYLYWYSFFNFKISGAISFLLSRRLIEEVKKKESNLSEISLLSIISNGYVIVSLISVATALVTTGFIETLMEIYLESFSLSVENIGICFLALGKAPLTQKISNKPKMAYSRDAFTRD